MSDQLFRTKYNLPKANVVRIRTLTSSERERYLGVIDATADAYIKSSIYDRVYGPDGSMFYGILQDSDSHGISITPEWQADDGNGTIGGMLRKMAADTGIGQVIGSAGDMLRALTGISGSSTGSATMTAFTKSSLSDFSITCAWVLTDQYDFCVHSLKAIMRMAYPVQVSDADVRDSLKDVINKVGNALTDSNAQTGASGDANDNQMGMLSSAINSVGDTAITGVSFVNDLFGRNLALDPIPVRCTLGHYMDIEPLVINGVKVKFSSDTFLHPTTGYHLPVTCTVDISFKFWLCPAPKMEFMKLLGKEMFGEGITEEMLAERDAAEQQSQLQRALTQETEKRRQDALDQIAQSRGRGE